MLEWRQLDLRWFLFFKIMQIESSHEDGSVVFRDGSTILADVILHCTGYIFTQFCFV